jgi:hypothetical protein
MPGLEDGPEGEGCCEEWEEKEEGEEVGSRWRPVFRVVLILGLEKPLVGKTIEEMHGVALVVGA